MKLRKKPFYVNNFKNCLLQKLCLCEINFENLGNCNQHIEHQFHHHVSTISIDCTIVFKRLTVSDSIQRIYSARE